jgi:hypothetical protein
MDISDMCLCRCRRVCGPQNCWSTSRQPVPRSPHVQHPPTTPQSVASVTSCALSSSSASSLIPFVSIIKRANGVHVHNGLMVCTPLNGCYLPCQKRTCTRTWLQSISIFDSLVRQMMIYVLFILLAQSMQLVDNRMPHRYIHVRVFIERERATAYVVYREYAPFK